MQPSILVPAAPYHAVFSPCGCYRYDWHYRWAKGRTVLFIGLNPSTANQRGTDATARRCVAYAKRWGYGAVRLVNLFAWIDTDPSKMLQAAAPVGPETDEHLVARAAEADLIVAVWGNNGSHQGRDRAVKAMLSGRLHALRVNKNGSPSHPLYLRKDLVPVPYA